MGHCCQQCPWPYTMANRGDRMAYVVLALILHSPYLDKRLGFLEGGRVVLPIRPAQRDDIRSNKARGTQRNEGKSLEHHHDGIMVQGGIKD